MENGMVLIWFNELEWNKKNEEEEDDEIQCTDLLSVYCSL